MPTPRKTRPGYRHAERRERLRDHRRVVAERRREHARAQRTRSLRPPTAPSHGRTAGRGRPRGARAGSGRRRRRRRSRALRLQRERQQLRRAELLRRGLVAEADGGARGHRLEPIDAIAGAAAHPAANVDRRSVSRSGSSARISTRSSGRRRISMDGLQRVTVAHQQRHPGVVAERQVADARRRRPSRRDAVLVRPRRLAADAHRQLPRQPVLQVHRDAQPAGHQRHERALCDDGREHRDEDQVVDACASGDAAEDRERGEQDRHGALQPAERDERLLGPAHAHARQRDRHDERPDHHGQHHDQHETLDPVADGEVGECTVSAERDEHHQLGQSGQRALEPFDLGLVGQPGIADEQSSEEDCQEPGAVSDRGRAVQGRPRA